eukprot:m.205897 g.205897  ORF g.205897 m.205897 type:complete len:454 (+) comp53880_c0_seq8:47-1408(+)
MALLPLLLLLLCGAFGSDDEVLARWMSQTVFDGQWQALTVQDNSFRTTKAVPAHRYNHACVTDARRGRMILTMGYFYDHQNRRPSWMADTWAFDLTRHRWTLLHDGADSSYGVGPSGRYGHTAVVHEEFMYVFGGSGDTEISKSNPSLAADTGGELWRFNLVTYEWEQIFGTLDTPTMPHPRLLHTATVISTPRGEAMMVHGGMLRQHSPVYKDDTWLLYFDSMEWEEWVGGHGPGDRYGASLDALHDTAYLFAGVSRVDGRLHNEMFTFTYQNGWSKVEYNQDPATVPTPRNYHSTALFVDESKSTKELGATGIVLFAGANCTGSCICKNDVWMFDLSSEIWYPIAMYDDLSTRYHQTLVHYHGKFYTFGGESYSPTYMYHNSVTALKIQKATGSGIFLWEPVACAALGRGTVSTFLIMLWSLQFHEQVAGDLQASGRAHQDQRTTRAPGAL